MEPTVPSHDHLQLGEIEWPWEDNKAVDNALAELQHGCPTLFEQIDLTVENALAGLDPASPNLFEQYFEWTDKAFEDALVVEPNHGAPPPNHLFGWAWEDNKTLENAVVEPNHHHVHGSSNLFEPVTLRDSAQIQIKDIIEDTQMTEASLVIPPNHMMNNNGGSSTTVPEIRAKHPRKKPIRWTPEEHELFLKGLLKYGKGDWKHISRFCVVTRTPAQVASHAQKYFIRLNKSQNIHGKYSNIATTATNAPAAPSPHQCIF